MSDPYIIAKRCYDQRRILIGRRAIIHGNWRIVDRANRDGDSRCRCATLAIADRVGDRICTIEIGVGRVSDRAIGIDGHGSVWRGCTCDAQWITVNIAIIAKHWNDNGLVLGRRRNIIGGNGCIVDWRNGNCDRGCG